jgi:uncharacterized protein (DUF1501 family)
MIDYKKKCYLQSKLKSSLVIVALTMGAPPTWVGVKKIFFSKIRFEKIYFVRPKTGYL